jgi:hypothetical protein
MSDLKGKLKVKYNGGYIVIHPETTADKVLNLDTTILDTIPQKVHALSTEYSVGDIVYSKDLPSWAYLECTTAGTSSDTTVAEISSSATEGQSITDGTVTWLVHKIGNADSELLKSISSTGIAANQIQYGTAENKVATTAISSVGRDILAKTSASDVLTYLGGATAASVSAIKQFDLSSISHTDLNHNSFYRGKDLTTYFTSGEMSKAIAAGTFMDIFPGDYITMTVTVDDTTYSNVKWIVGDIDYHYKRGWRDNSSTYGDSSGQTTEHHVLMFPEGVLGSHYMNSSNVTTGAYIGSAMWKTYIPKYATGIQNAFGTSHVLGHNEILANSMGDNLTSSAGAGQVGSSNDWAWYPVLANLFNEPMVYGTTSFSSSACDVGDCNTQIAVFRLNKAMSFVRDSWYWLRAVASASDFCGADIDGCAGSSIASFVGGVRPYFLLR